MWILRRRDRVAAQRSKRRPQLPWSRLRALLVIVPLALVPALQAQVTDAQRAIENLEGCDREERKKGCIKILKRESRGEGRQAIKAQVRGGRIIWYEFDKKSGSVRRTN